MARAGHKLYRVTRGSTTLQLEFLPGVVARAAKGSETCQKHMCATFRELAKSLYGEKEFVYYRELTIEALPESPATGEENDLFSL